MSYFNSTFEKRFWKKVLKTETCWIWTASKKEGKSYGQIKLLFSVDKITQTELAIKYNVSQVSISAIIRGATWKHIT